MLLPTKYDSLDKNIIVIGSYVISRLKKGEWNIQNLFNNLKENRNVSLDQFYDTLTFLWLSDIIDLGIYYVSLNKKNN